MPTVLIVPEMLREQPGPFLDVLKEAGLEIRYPQNPLLARGGLSDEEAIAELKVAQATLASVEKYSSTVLRELPQLRVIARVGVGYDSIDVPAASEHKIPVTITPNANHEAVAELALALMFAVTKSIVVNDNAIRAGRWPRSPLVPLRTQTLGVVGLGRIGRSLAVRAVSLGMKVLAFDTVANEDFCRQHQIEAVSFDNLLRNSDLVSVHCPLIDATRELFNADVFAKMKVGSYFINTSRGGLVNEADLLQALESGHLKGAGLDVLAVEPPAADHPLFRLPQVVFSPHMAGVDRLSLEAMAVEAATCIARLYQGQWPSGAVVNDALQSGWQW